MQPYSVSKSLVFGNLCNLINYYLRCHFYRNIKYSTSSNINIQQSSIIFNSYIQSELFESPENPINCNLTTGVAFNPSELWHTDTQYQICCCWANLTHISLTAQFNVILIWPLTTLIITIFWIIWNKYKCVKIQIK